MGESGIEKVWHFSGGAQRRKGGGPESSVASFSLAASLCVTDEAVSTLSQTFPTCAAALHRGHPRGLTLCCRDWAWLAASYKGGLSDHFQ